MLDDGFPLEHTRVEPILPPNRLAQGVQSHTTHFACDERIALFGGKTVGCCCSGHVCKDDSPETIAKATEGSMDKRQPVMDDEALPHINQYLVELEQELRTGGGATLDELYNLALAVKDELLVIKQQINELEEK